jgi:hypothetical protein
MKILFCDTNKLHQCSYKLLQNIDDDEVLYFKEMCSIYECYISSFVVFELWKTLKRRYGIDVNRKELSCKLEYLGFHIVLSDKDHHGEYRIFVRDHADEQILIDAITVDADIIFTNNLKDFHIQLIREKLGINVIKKL